jgi:MFS family permease
MWIGMSATFLGEGILPVALAWQVYKKMNGSPSAFATLGLCMTLPQVALLVWSGVLSDRHDRRPLLVIAVAVQGLAIAALGVFTVAGSVRLWQMALLAVAYGSGQALFGPAHTAIVPELVHEDLLVQANSLRTLSRPMAMNFIGPGLGGVLVAAVDPGPAFLLDAGAFVLAAVFFLAISHRRSPREEEAETSAWYEALEGLRFVRRRAWLWGSMVAATVMLLVFVGPVEVLVPYIVKKDLHGSAFDLGLVLGSGGLGALLASLALGQLGLPKRAVTFMYLAWVVASASLAGYALVTSTWQAAAVSVVMEVSFAGLSVVWMTLLQRLVPGELLGRVSSLDWLVSAGLVPLSFALTGPIASAIGARATMAWGGLLGGAVVLAFFLFLPGIRSPEQDGSLERASSSSA